MSRRVGWFSCGAASAVACKLMIVEWEAAGRPGELVIATCDTGSEDADNHRFARDCEAWFGHPITVLRSTEYVSTWDVWERRKFISGANGAPCTVELKIAPRLEFQRPDDIQFFGYTADRLDVARAERFREHWFEVDARFPLIERGLNKLACRAMLAGAGIAEPRTYAEGYPNANCVESGCGKATSPDYWALHRLRRPEGFARTAALARRLGAKLAIIGREKDGDGKDRNIRAFIDDIPADWPILNPEAPVCDLLCHIASADLEETA